METQNQRMEWKGSQRSASSKTHDPQCEHGCLSLGQELD